MQNREPNRYTKILEAIFIRHFKKGATEIEFERAEFAQAAMSRESSCQRI